MTNHLGDLDLDLDSTTESDSGGDSGGFVTLAVLAAALGAGAAVLFAPDEGSKTRQRVGRKVRSLSDDTAEKVSRLQREIRRRRNQSRREKRMVALAGVLIGAGIAALIAPGGEQVRSKLGGTFSRIKVGAVDRIERLRTRPVEPAVPEEDREVRSVQELGRDPNNVF
jgi:hypothetical protein